MPVAVIYQAIQHPECCYWDQSLPAVLKEDPDGGAPTEFMDQLKAVAVIQVPGGFFKDGKAAIRAADAMAHAANYPSSGLRLLWQPPYDDGD